MVLLTFVSILQLGITVWAVSVSAEENSAPLRQCCDYEKVESPDAAGKKGDAADGANQT